MILTAVLLSIVLIVIDQLTKYAALYYLEPIGSYPIIDGVFELAFVINRGASFGILQGGRTFFLVLTPVILVGIAVYYIRLPKVKPYGWVRLSLIFIFSGALGNFIDRARQGYVIDFFYAKIINFPVFNMADIFIVLGTFLPAVLFIFVIKEDAGKRADREVATGEGGDNGAADDADAKKDEINSAVTDADGGANRD